jgi:hypothetical protein
LIAVERQGSVRAQPVENDKIVTLLPIVNQNVKHEAHLMTDQHHSFRRIASDYAGHSTVNHFRKQYVDGDTHTNTAESFGAILERAKLGVFHYMSSEHLSRYLNEIGFRWDHRIPEVKITKNGNKKKYMKPMPFMIRLRSLLSRCVGRQVRRTINFGIISSDNMNFEAKQPCYCL